jgi:flagella basal body P-ring formation protein FlgA
MLLLASLFLASFPGGVKVTLEPQARVRGTEIELGAIAKVEGDDAAEVERVRALRLGYAPAPGYSRLLAGARLETEVERLLPGVEATFVGAPSCRVLPTTELLTAAQLSAAAKAEIARWSEGRDIELEPLSSLADLEIPSGEKPFELRALIADAALRPGPLNVPVRVMVDGQLYRTVWSNWRVTVFEEVNVLRSALRAGESLAPELFERRRVALTAGNTDTPASLGQALGARAARDMAAGHVLRQSDVKLETLVKRGDTLFLEIRRGAITARVAATADQDARAGDRIRMTLLDSGKTINAVVLSRDLALVDLARQG